MTPRLAGRRTRFTDRAELRQPSPPSLRRVDFSISDLNEGAGLGHTTNPGISGLGYADPTAFAVTESTNGPIGESSVEVARSAPDHRPPPGPRLGSVMPRDDHQMVAERVVEELSDRGRVDLHVELGAAASGSRCRG